ncbi:fork head domain-containing protein [Phlyctema vagabunda]|uniref:Fork head domain-containing protein n=1 Tax=Phlyctema vagabunda TaxID=108571 RepID=A0ABR4PBJ2_9HELO
MTMFKPANPPVAVGGNGTSATNATNVPSRPNPAGSYQRLASDYISEIPRNTSSPIQLPPIRQIASGSPFSHEETLTQRWKRSAEGPRMDENTHGRRVFSNVEMGTSRQGSEVRDGEYDYIHGPKRKPSGSTPMEVHYTRRSDTADEGILTDPGSPHRRKRAKTEDEKEQRRLERLLSNRLAAEKSRERKRREFDVLKAEKEEIERSNQHLIAKIADLEARYQGAPSDREYFQVEEELEPSQPLPVANDTFRKDQEKLDAAWKHLSKQSASLEEERQRFADEKLAWRQEYEMINRGTVTKSSRDKDMEEASKWNTEREALKQELARMTAELEQSENEKGRLQEEHKKREDDIHKSHHDHKVSLLEARDNHAVNLVNLLNQKDQELVRKDEHIRELDKLATLKSDALSSAETQSTTRENLMKTLDDLIVSLQSTIASKDGALNTLQQNLHASEAEVRYLQEQLSRQSLAKETPQVHSSSSKLDVEVPGSELRTLGAAMSIRDEDIPSIKLPQPAATPAKLKSSSKSSGMDDSQDIPGSDSNAIGDEIVVSVRADYRPPQFKKPSSRSKSLGRDLVPDIEEPRRRTRSGNQISKADRKSPGQMSSEPKESRKLRERSRKSRDAEEECIEVDYDDGSKPAHSYTHLIGMAIVESPDRQLRLAEIYKWISDTYSFYSVDAPLRKDWKNAIRSTLSTNKKFIRQWRPGEDPAKGSYWGIQEGEDEEFIGRPIYVQSKSTTARGTKTRHSTS